MSTTRVSTTRTFVFFFDEEDLAPLADTLAKLQTDWTERRDHVPAHARNAGDARIGMLADVVQLLAEPVPESEQRMPLGTLPVNDGLPFRPSFGV